MIHRHKPDQVQKKRDLKMAPFIYHNGKAIQGDYFYDDLPSDIGSYIYENGYFVETKD